MLFLFVFFVSARLQVSFIPLRFRCFGQRFSFRTADLSRESQVMPPLYDFRGKRIEIIFRGRCRPRKLKSEKNNRHVFETKPRKFGDANISHYTVSINISENMFCEMFYAYHDTVHCLLATFI